MAKDSVKELTKENENLDEIKKEVNRDIHAEQYLTFKLSGDIFALDILNVKEIIEYANITTVPMTPEYVQGVLNLRGQVVPVIDLSARFHLEREEVSRTTCIVVVELYRENEIIDIGIIVDAVDEVISVLPEEIEPSPSFGARIRPEFIQGMAKVHDQFIILLNVDYVLDVDELSKFDQSGLTKARIQKRIQQRNEERQRRAAEAGKDIRNRRKTTFEKEKKRHEENAANESRTEKNLKSESAEKPETEQSAQPVTDSRSESSDSQKPDPEADTAAEKKDTVTTEETEKKKTEPHKENEKKQ